MTSQSSVLISIVGPTAVGKTSFAINLASQLQTEIISVDSRQFYKEMEIGTAKPSKEELEQVNHHFINSQSIHEDYSVGKFEEESKALLKSLFKKYQVIVAVGGAGLFFKSLWHGLDEMPDIDLSQRIALNDQLASSGLAPLLEELRQKDEKYFDVVDKQNHQRVIRALEVIRSTNKPFSDFRKSKPEKPVFYQNIKIGLHLEREILFNRIDERMDKMILSGLFDEAKRLYPFRKHNALQTVGYKEIFDFIDGKYDFEEAVRLLKRNSRRYAKRQQTWFKKESDIRWVEPHQISETLNFIKEWLDAHHMNQAH
ncbi:MAG: tRNA (adenosine(37)-N6)-dimethylallyltransferase MiaA [Cyclobacteriaceae bacterium]